MHLININHILYLWTINYDIFSAWCMDKSSICNIDKCTFSICVIEKLSISGINKKMFVYIAYGYFVHT